MLDVMMRLIPLPELVVVLVMAVVVLGVRALFGFKRARLTHRAGGLSQPRDERMETERMRARLTASCVLIAIISIPLILRVVPPNGIYGFRTGLTQSDSAIWYPANAFMGWALLVAAVVSGTLLATLPATVKRWLLWVTLWVPVFGAILASFVYLKRLG